MLWQKTFFKLSPLSNSGATRTIWWRICEHSSAIAETTYLVHLIHLQSLLPADGRRTLRRDPANERQGEEASPLSDVLGNIWTFGVPQSAIGWASPNLLRDAFEWPEES